MKIVILDGYTLNPGDLSWGEIEKLGELKVYDRTPPEMVKERMKDAEIVLTNKTPLTKELIAGAASLKYIGVLATGYNVVDIGVAERQGITVTNVPSYGTDSVAQFVFALLLELCHRVGQHSEDVRAGGWSVSPDFSYTRTQQVELSGKTMGIIGYGRIGRQVGRLAEAFGMSVLASGSSRSTSGNADETIRRVQLEQLLAEADVISLHCPLTPETRELLNQERVSLMKRTSFLINTARGGLIQEQSLADALNEGRLAGAALDVLSIEPPMKGHPLLLARNCIITPHMAWATAEARARLMGVAARNVAAFIEGMPVNRVVPD